jgi:hypothetical protein
MPSTPWLVVSGDRISQKSFSHCWGWRLQAVPHFLPGARHRPHSD